MTRRLDSCSWMGFLSCWPSLPSTWDLLLWWYAITLSSNAFTSEICHLLLRKEELQKTPIISDLQILNIPVHIYDPRPSLWFKHVLLLSFDSAWPLIVLQLWPYFILISMNMFFFNSMQYALKLETTSMTFIHKNIWCFGEKKIYLKYLKWQAVQQLCYLNQIHFLGGMDVWTTF